MLDILTALRDIRDEEQMTQRDLAIAAKTSQSAIARMETGAIDPRLSTVCRIAETLHCRLVLIREIDMQPDEADACTDQDSPESTPSV